MTEGDTNTKFFHLMANGRQRINQTLNVLEGNEEYVSGTLGDHFSHMEWQGGKQANDEQWGSW